MAVSVQRLQYFYTEVPDKPGEGSKLLSLLHEKGVKLLAFSGFPQGRRAQLDFMPINQEEFRAAAKKAKIKLVGPRTCLLIQGDDWVGSVYEITVELAKAKINVIALKAITAGAGRFGAILWVKQRDFGKAAKVLGVLKENRLGLYET